MSDVFSQESMPVPVNPRPNLAELTAELAAREYSHFNRQCIESYARAIGSLEGCTQVDPEDRPVLDEILERAWPEVPADSERWDADTWQGAPSSWTLERSARIEALWEAHGTTLYPDDGPDACHELEWYDEPADLFIPSEADEAFYQAWSDSLPPVTLETEPFHP